MFNKDSPRNNEEDVGTKLIELILMLLEDQTGEKYELVGVGDKTA